MATSICASSVSIPKPNVTGCTDRRKSCDTTCSTNSSCFLQKRKPMNPLASSVRPTGSRTNNHQSFVRQRVLSAKMIKLRSFQSQLNDANFHLVELAKENRALKNLQRRQDKALKNYEGVDADLPRLIRSHEEQNRVLHQKNKALKKAVKELLDQVKIKDDELTIVRDQFKHLTNLTKDKHLLEREKLNEQLEDSKATMNKSQAEISILNRKLTLETKNCKQKLNNEFVKHKQCQKELAFAMGEIDRLNGLVEGRDRLLVKRRNHPKRDSKSSSLVNLNLKASVESVNKDGDGSDTHSITSSDIKLERISNGKDSIESNNSLEMLKSPTEKIKARLSSGKSSHITLADINATMKKLNIEEDGLKKNVYSMRANNSRPNSTKLVSIKHNSDEKQINIIPTLDDILDKQIGTDVANSPEIVEEKHVAFATTIDDAKLMQELHETDAIDNKLREKKKNDIILDDTDFELVNKIWSEEFSFRKDHKDTNGYVTQKDPGVALEDKKKLLAALRAIDNGKSIESVVGDRGDSDKISECNTDSKKTRLIKELFG